MEGSEFVRYDGVDCEERGSCEDVVDSGDEGLYLIVIQTRGEMSTKRLQPVVEK